MKSILALVFFMSTTFFGAIAQKPIVVSEDSIIIGNSQLPCLTVTIPEAAYDKTLKAWIKGLQKGTTSKVITENDEMWIFGANIKAISQDPINVYSNIIQLDSSLQLFATFELRKDQYAVRGAGEADFGNALEYIKEFSKIQYIEVAKDEAKDEAKKLRHLQKELSSLENEKSRMLKSIDSNKSKILKERGNLFDQNNNLRTVSAILVNNNIPDGRRETDLAQKEKIKKVRDLEREKKKALNSIKSSERKIYKANSVIDKATLNIPKNERMQIVLREQIFRQEAVSQKFSDKLKKIKSY